MEKEKDLELLNPNNTDQEVDTKFTKGQFTIDDFLNGKFYHVPNKRLVLDGLENKYQDLITEEGFLTKVYHIDKKHIIAHIQIPSQNIEDLFYDVLIEFNNYSEGQPISSVNAKFFSNSPSFIFTYAYLFNSKHILIDGAKILVEDKKVFTQPPVRNNYYQVMSFDKTLYFACRYLIDTYHNLSGLENEAIKQHFNFKMIRTVEEILLEYKDKKKRTSYKKKHDSELNKRNQKFEDFASRNANKLKDKINDNKSIKKDNPVSKITGLSNMKQKIKGKKKITGRSKIRGSRKIK